MKYVLPVVGMVCTAFATLLMLVFMMAGAANSSADQLRSTKLWAGGLSILSLMCIVAAIVLMRRDRCDMAALVAVVVMGILYLAALF